MNNKLNGIQVIRAFAFIGVYISHSPYAIKSGSWGVSVFFVLSGFVIAYNSLKKDNDVKCGVIKNVIYSAKHIRKLYWLHILMFLLSLFYMFESNAVSLKSAVMNVLLIQIWNPKMSMTYNGVAWFLSAMTFI